MYHSYRGLTLFDYSVGAPELTLRKAEKDLKCPYRDCCLPLQGTFTGQNNDVRWLSPLTSSSAYDTIMVFVLWLHHPSKSKASYNPTLLSEDRTMLSHNVIWEGKA